jgi:hypothetical protein
VLLSLRSIVPFFSLLFSTLSKVHFDSLPSQWPVKDKVIDGARDKWCYPILLDAFLSVLQNNKFDLSSRRLFHQTRILQDCILYELKDSYSKLVEEVFISSRSTLIGGAVGPIVNPTSMFLTSVESADLSCVTVKEELSDISVTAVNGKDYFTGMNDPYQQSNYNQGGTSCYSLNNDHFHDFITFPFIEINFPSSFSTSDGLSSSSFFASSSPYSLSVPGSSSSSCYWESLSSLKDKMYEDGVTYKSKNKFIRIIETLTSHPLFIDKESSFQGNLMNIIKVVILRLLFVFPIDGCNNSNDNNQSHYEGEMEGMNKEMKEEKVKKVDYLTSIYQKLLKKQNNHSVVVVKKQSRKRSSSSLSDSSYHSMSMSSSVSPSGKRKEREFTSFYLGSRDSDECDENATSYTTSASSFTTSSASFEANDPSMQGDEVDFREVKGSVEDEGGQSDLKKRRRGSSLSSSDSLPLWENEQNNNDHVDKRLKRNVEENVFLSFPAPTGYPFSSFFSENSSSPTIDSSGSSVQLSTESCGNEISENDDRYHFSSCVYEKQVQKNENNNKSHQENPGKEESSCTDKPTLESKEEGDDDIWYDLLLSSLADDTFSGYEEKQQNYHSTDCTEETSKSLMEVNSTCSTVYVGTSSSDLYQQYFPVTIPSTSSYYGDVSDNLSSALLDDNIFYFFERNSLLPLFS